MKKNGLPLVSIILPVYNVEKYLPKCLDSLTNQSYSNIEIIAVDDGSADGSGAVCDSYAEKDRRISVIHKQNGGVSDARNRGIAAAKGDYITQADPDDFVDGDYVEYLYGLISEHNADISVCTHRIIKGKKTYRSYNLKKDETLSSKESVEKLLRNDGIDTSAWAKLYKRSLFGGILYPKGKIFEDHATTYKLLMKAETIVSGRESKYNYILRGNSIVRSPFSPSKLDMIEVTDKMCEEILRVYPELAEAALRRRVYSRLSTLNQVINCEGYDSIKKDLTGFIKANAKAVICGSAAQIRDKTACALVCVSLGLYKFVWNNFGKK